MLCESAAKFLIRVMEYAVMASKSSSTTSTPTCMIKDLKPPRLAADRYNIYCVALAVDRPGSSLGPYRMAVTDFTRNKNVVRESHRVATELPDDMVMQVEIFPDKYESFVSSYRTAFRSALHNEGFTTYFDRELLLLRLYIKPKVYRQTLEGKLLSSVVITKESPEWGFSLQLQELGAQIANRKMFSKGVMDQIIPTRYLSQSSLSSLSMSSQDVSTQIKDIPTYDRIKHEKFDNDIIPGNQYAHDEDLEDDISEEIIPDSLQEHQKANASIGSLSDGSLPFAEMVATLSIKEVNQIDMQLDNKVYIIEAKIADFFPQDLSYICAKPYSLDGWLLQPQDPKLRPLEIILTDVKAGSFVQQQHLLKLHIDEDQLLSFLKLPVEMVYTKPEILSEKLLNLQKKHNYYRIYKKKIELNGNTSIVAWTCQNFLC